MREIDIDLLSHFVDRNEEISERRKKKITLGRRKILYYIDTGGEREFGNSFRSGQCDVDQS